MFRHSIHDFTSHDLTNFKNTKDNTIYSQKVLKLVHSFFLVTSWHTKIAAFSEVPTFRPFPTFLTQKVAITNDLYFENLALADAAISLYEFSTAKSGNVMPVA